MKRLSELISSLTIEELSGDTTREISKITFDSREAAPGTLFVAVKGSNADGHSFIPQVVEAGAAAVVCEEMPPMRESGVTYIKVPNSHVALGYIASAWYDNPSGALRLVGVTGTNGKTTTATLIYEMARLMGHKAGLLSTVVNLIDEEKVEAHQTTPDAITINALLRRMVDAGCTYCAMEVSSHAAEQHRIAGLEFAGGIFTNLTRDHLDYHKTVEAYLAAKKSFFDGLPRHSFALTNLDDKTGLVMLQNTMATRHTYSLRGIADFTTKIVESRLDGMLLDINGREVETMFTGRFNAYNLTAVYGACVLLGWDPEKVLVNMSRLVPVAGRFQSVHSPSGYTAIVDYAHTPDAVINVLNAIREVVGTTGRIITVVGAGGNRDKGKRPIMAKEAAMRSDFLVLTSDNPRFEEPEDILRDMEAGLDDEARTHSVSITDRREAIAEACRMAAKGDVVLIAGKGHEDYQEVKGVKHHFDDREVVLDIFASQKPQD